MRKRQVGAQDEHGKMLSDVMRGPRGPPTNDYRTSTSGPMTEDHHSVDYIDGEGSWEQERTGRGLPGGIDLCVDGLEVDFWAASTDFLLHIRKFTKQQVMPNRAIREIPDHATFRGKGVKTGLVRQIWGMSLFGPM